MTPHVPRSGLTRRALLGAAGAGLLAGAVARPGAPRAQTPKRGGTLTIRAWDPPHFDPMLTTAYRVQIPLSFTHSRLLRHRAGPASPPAPSRIEGDLAESWTQPTETTYVFKLRRGVRWHPKPPVNGRELTAEDVRYTVERFLTVKGNPERLHAASRRARGGRRSPHGEVHAQGAVRLVPGHAREPHVHGDRGPRVRREPSATSRSAESVVGTGPWMLEQLPAQPRAHARAPPCVLRAGPALHRPHRGGGGRGQRLAHGRVPRRQVRPRLGVPRRHRAAPTTSSSRTRCASGGPELRTAGVPVQRGAARVDADRPAALLRRARAPGPVARHRSPGHHRRRLRGRRRAQPGAVPAAFKDWSLPIAQLGEGAPLLPPRRGGGAPAARGRRLSERLPGHALPSPPTDRRRSPTPRSSSSSGSGRGRGRPARPAGVRRVHRAPCYFGKFDTLAFGPQTPYTDPHSYVFGMHYPGGAEEPEPRQRPGGRPISSGASSARSTWRSGATCSTSCSGTSPGSSTTSSSPRRDHLRRGTTRSRTTGRTSATTTAAAWWRPGSTGSPLPRPGRPHARSPPASPPIP